MVLKEWNQKHENFTAFFDLFFFFLYIYIIPFCWYYIVHLNYVKIFLRI